MTITKTVTALNVRPATPHVYSDIDDLHFRKTEDIGVQPAAENGDRDELRTSALLLGRQGLRRGVQLLGGPHDAARLGSNPEVVQVSVVHRDLRSRLRAECRWLLFYGSVSRLYQNLRAVSRAVH